MNTDRILEELLLLKKLISEQNLLQKEVLNFNDAAQYLDVSASHLYKLTSAKQIPHYCPQGKRLYFKRCELDLWLQRNKQLAVDEIESLAGNYLIRKGKRF